MGLTNIQQGIIKAIAENDIRKAKQYAVAALREDTTQKNKFFTDRYISILTSEGNNLLELPSDLKGLVYCEDVSLSFHENRYYITEQQKELAEKIFRMASVSQKLMELQIPYKNATLLYGPPGTGKTMFGKYIAYKKKLPFCYLNFSNVVDSYMGATSRNIAKIFTYASSNPCVFMLDEVDSIGCNRDKVSGSADREMGRVTITLMQEFDKLPNDVIVIAATNRIDMLDKAFVSRFPVQREMKPFTTGESRCMVKKFLTDIGYEFSEEEMIKIVGGCKDQRQIMSSTVQLLAEKLEREGDE